VVAGALVGPGFVLASGLMGGSVWLALRFAKFVGMLAFGMGIAGALMGGTAAQRQRAAYWLATPGFLLTAVAGYGLVKATGASLGAPWIAGSLLLSLVALELTVRSVEPGRSRSLARVLGIVGALVVVLALMVWRPGAA
jgi:hypothetical protein